MMNGRVPDYQIRDGVPINLVFMSISVRCFNLWEVGANKQRQILTAPQNGSTSAISDSTDLEVSTCDKRSSVI